MSAEPSVPEPERPGPGGRGRALPPRIVLWVAGGVFVMILAVAFYYSPMHFGLDRIRAQWAFDDGVEHDKENRRDQAIERYDRAIRLNPELVEAYNNRGSDRRRKGDLDGAIADYGEVIRLRPDTEAGYYNRAVTWRMKGDDEAALSDFAAAIVKGRAQLQWLQQHRGGGQIGLLTNARLKLDARSNLSDAYLGRARALEDKGNYEDAIVSLDEAIAVAETTWPSEAHFERARVRLLKGQFAEAEAEFDRFVADKAGYLSGALMYRGFLALFRANDPKAAAENFERSLQEGFAQPGTLRGLFDGSGPWLSNGVRLYPNVHHLIVWQHVARERTGQDDRKELTENLLRLARRQGYSTASDDAMAKSRANWPGPIIDMFLRTRTPEAVRAAAEASADPKVRRQQTCDADFYTGLFRLKSAKAEARALLQRAADNCPPGTFAGVGARLELERAGT